MKNLEDIPVAEGTSLLLVRHFESAKNVSETFSSVENQELLTEEGFREARYFAEALYAWISNSGRTLGEVNCASSIRAIKSAEVIADLFDVEIVPHAGLLSTGSGELAGISAKDAMASHPTYMHQLSLYRSGLFNSYDLATAVGKEEKRVFEERVAKSIDQILAKDSHDVKLVFSHRSPITSTLVRFARDYYNYPRDFLGYVELDFGAISHLFRERDRWRVVCVNMPFREFSN